MTRDKQIINYAKGLLKISLEDGEFSEERASAVLQYLEKNPPRKYASVLKEYLKLVQREVANSTAAVEHAGELSSSAIEAIKAKFSAHYGRKISVTTRQNDSLIAGLRVRVGCDVYDSSVAGSLHELEATLS
ncbi:F0F1 ATP synthase subunit delta [Pelagicoccus sp. SDUM812002]|uniref:F0F1 ATP synthase subunit delta n=1 Tax=Pelagicoccus sp. SDUM812002 TaxID=3041266 RepID=UPI00280C9991|nr:F0F1 ATP synthase subunit delta [Pelagicoccus sp. SDUM812002]MDQ8184713.1 F0F1 ATP synthase subunit delta [Pelagicoccus sp. SDUM812002]